MYSIIYPFKIYLFIFGRMKMPSRLCCISVIRKKKVSRFLSLSVWCVGGQYKQLFNFQWIDNVSWPSHQFTSRLIEPYAFVLKFSINHDHWRCQFSRALNGSRLTSFTGNTIAYKLWLLMHENSYPDSILDFYDLVWAYIA